MTQALNTLRQLLIVTLLLLPAACQSTPQKAASEWVTIATSSDFERFAETNKARADRKRRQFALTQQVSLKATNQSLASICEELSWQASYGIKASPSIAGEELTVTLDKASLKEALTLIGQLVGADLRWAPKSLILSPPQETTLALEDSNLSLVLSLLASMSGFQLDIPEPLTKVAVSYPAGQLNFSTPTAVRASLLKVLRDHTDYQLQGRLKSRDLRLKQGD